MFTKNKKLFFIAGAAIAFIVVLFLGFAVFVSSYKNTYPNTYIADINVSGKSEEQIVALLDAANEDRFSNASFSVRVADINKEVHSTDLAVAIDSKKGAELAFVKTSGGNFLTKPFKFIKAAFSRNEIKLPIAFDSELLALVTKEFAAANVPPIDASYVIEDDEMTLTPPIDGLLLNEEAFAQTLVDKFSAEDYSDITVELEFAEAAHHDMDKLYEEVHTTASDAKVEVVDGKNIITPHIVGIDFDLAAAKRAHDAAPHKEVVIPLTVTNPKVTTLMVQSTLFQDTLSSKTTYYSPKKVNRCINVRLAASLVNGTILNPGEVFSFNKVVGRRTAARGFKEAGVFSNGELVDGLGGGICQVSSTIYLASMHADMKTVSRKNHSFYVDYAPKGQDATVVYGSIDFQFENTSEYPIKILAHAQNNYITVTIKGTKTTQKTVKITTNTLSTTPYTTKTVVNNSLKPGERVVHQAGQPGMTMDVYRHVYDKNGKLISKTYENKTRYIPMTEIIHVGPAATTAPVQTPQQPAVSPEPPKQPVTPTVPEEKPAISETPSTPETPTVPETPAEPESPAEPETPSSEDPPVTESDSNIEVSEDTETSSDEEASDDNSVNQE